MNFEAVLYYKNQQSGNDGNGNESILRTPPSNTSSVSSCLFTSDFCLFVYLFVSFLLIWDKRIRWNSRFAGFCFLAVMFRSHLPVCVFIDCLKFRTLWYNVSDLTKVFFFCSISFLPFSLLFSAFTANPCQSLQIIIRFLGNCSPTPPLSQH